MMNENCFRTLHLPEPWTLKTYVENGGYEVWKKVVSGEIPPEEIIDKLKFRPYVVVVVRVSRLA